MVTLPPLPLLPILGCAALLAVLVFFSFVVVDPFQGKIITRFGKMIRSAGPGLRWLWPWERVEYTISLLKRVANFTGEFETDAEEPVDLEVMFEYVPHPSRLVQIQYFDFEKDPKKLEGLLTERIRSVLQSVIRTKKNRDEVMNHLRDIASGAKIDFEAAMAENGDLLQEYYGINLQAITIADPKLPEKLKQAAVEREVQEKENKRRALEMTKIKSMAEALVKSSKKLGKELSYEVALNVILITLGKVKKDIKEFHFDSGTTNALAALLKGFKQ